MRKISEKTILTALVNLKCVGYFGKCFTPLSMKEREFVINKMIENGWLQEEPFGITPKGDEIVKKNLSLCQY